MRAPAAGPFATRALSLAFLLAAAPAAHALDDPLQEIGVTPYCWRRHGTTFEGDTGASVVIGVVWTGFDLYHPDLMAADGRTRVLAVWDQSVTTGGTASFGYGTEWSAAEIDNRRADIRTDDKGTALAVLAAGSGRASPRLTGIAPEAKLVLVRSTLDPWDIVDAVDYIFRVAAAARCPAVVDLSLNTHLSSHDGTDSLDVRLDRLTGPGRILVAAAGNEGGLGIHAAASLGESRVESLRFEVSDSGPLVPDLNNVCVFAAYPESADVTLRVRDSMGVQLLEAAKGATAWRADSVAQLKLCNGLGCEDCADFPGKTIAALQMFGAGDRWRAPGVWTLELEPRHASSGDRLDAWIQLPMGGPAARFEAPEDAKLVGWPACADSVISVGAYEPAPTFGDGREALWPQSSPGPLRDGREAVDLVAPGCRVRVPAGRDSTAQWSGTSFAAAYATGAVALLLGAHPNASPAQIRAELRRRAKPVAASADRWGHGKLWMGAPVE
ncbi:MAG: S8 family serine peptidase [bacterium]